MGNTRLHNVSARRSHPATKHRYRGLALEQLENRQLLAVLYEAFKTLDFTATGSFAGQLFATVNQPNDYKDEYNGPLANFAGQVSYGSSQATGTGSGTGSGSGTGTVLSPGAGIDSYAFDFNAASSFTVNGSQVQMTLATKQFAYSDSPMEGGYTAGDTPFDATFTGNLNISELPYSVYFQRQTSGTEPHPYSTFDALQLLLTPHAYSWDPGVEEPVDIVFEGGSFFNSTAEFYFFVTGPTLTAASTTAVISTVDFYYAKGPAASDIVGAPIESYPIRWNSSGADIVIDVPANLPAGVTHIVAIADGQQRLAEDEEGNNVASVAIYSQREMLAFAFTAVIDEFRPSANNHLESPSVAVGQTISGVFRYDAATGAFADVYVPLSGLSRSEILYFSPIWFDQNEDAQLDLTLYYSVMLPDSAGTSSVSYDFEFLNLEELVSEQLPTSLAGATGVLSIESWSHELFMPGFELVASINNVVPLGSFPGQSTQVTIAEETQSVVAIASLYQNSGVTVDPATVTITVPPQHGRVQVNATTGAVTYTPNANYFGNDSYQYFIRSAAGDASSEGLVSITLTAVPEPYQNPVNRYFVDPAYAQATLSGLAMIINRFNVTGPIPLAPPTGPVTEYWDVDGDNFLSLTDAAILLAIINAGSLTGGEPGSANLPEEPSPVGTAELADDLISSSDAVFAVVSNEEHAVSVLPELTVAAVDQAFGAIEPRAASSYWLLTTEQPQWRGYRAARSASTADASLMAHDNWWRNWRTM
ncbi:MAG TPA: Ig-like domain-containing protein [Pirellulaceae bacterium]|nr:Ig-like domain-containing protein [Pirellulaceae bacterium]